MLLKEQEKDCLHLLCSSPHTHMPSQVLLPPLTPSLNFFPLSIEKPEPTKLPGDLCRDCDASFTSFSLSPPLFLIPSLFMALSSHLQALTCFSITTLPLASLFLCSLLFHLFPHCWLTMLPCFLDA